MPRWPRGHVTKRTCPLCGGRKDYYSEACRQCKAWPKPLLGKTGPEHPTWKGGRIIDRDGYVRLYLPDHPWPRVGDYVLEHVALMERAIGRRIAENECVHHRDGDRQHNALTNLEIMSKSEHASFHARRAKGA